jgi:hypothetical protein
MLAALAAVEAGAQDEEIGDVSDHRDDDGRDEDPESARLSMSSPDASGSRPPSWMRRDAKSEDHERHDDSDRVLATSQEPRSQRRIFLVVAPRLAIRREAVRLGRARRLCSPGFAGTGIDALCVRRTSRRFRTRAR